MFRSGTLVSLIATTASLLSQAGAQDPADGGIIPGRFILEFAQDVAHGPLGAITDALNTIKNVASNVGIDISVREELNYKLFTGATVKVSGVENAADVIAHLSSHDSIKNVWADRLVAGPDRTCIAPGNGGQINMEPSDIQNAPLTPQIMTQVDKLHAMGYYGNGTIMCLIDSGVDYNHPALGNGFGPGHLVAFGYDFVGDNYNGTNDPVPDDDPHENCYGHGTHTTGIIAAQPNNKYGLVGAAPGVTIGMYRVLSCPVGVNTAYSVLIQAFNRAYDDGCHIISASVGGASGWSELKWSVVTERINNAGVPVIVSAANDGEKGLFYTAGPADAQGVPAVASVDNDITPDLSGRSNFTVDGETREFYWIPGDPGAWDNVNLPLWTPSFNTSDPAMACDPLPADTPDLSGYVVLIRRGTCKYYVKANNAIKYGAKYIIIYNVAHYEEPLADITPGYSPGLLAIGAINSTQGKEWTRALQAGKNITVSMVDTNATDFTLTWRRNTITGGLLSFFTSWGPTYELDTKPQFAAPGGSILSTYPLAMGGYGVDWGTSMSCPLVASIYALISQVRGTRDPALIQNLLAATARAQIYSQYEDYDSPNATRSYLASVAQQGAGTVQAYDAAFATTLLSRSYIALNDSDHFEGTANFSVKNLGSEQVSFTLGHVGAATGYTFSGSSPIPDKFPGLKTTDEFATVDFGGQSSITVPAGGEVEVSVTVTPPDLDRKRLPVYSGYITLNGTNGENLSLPYTGVVGSMRSIPLMDKVWISNSTDADKTPLTGPASFVLPKTVSDELDPKVTYPVIQASIVFGVKLFNIKLIALNSTSDTSDGLRIGSIQHMPGSVLPRAIVFPSTFNGALDGQNTTVPAGVYRFDVAALHVFGDESNDADYQVLRTEPFTLDFF